MEERIKHVLKIILEEFLNANEKRRYHLAEVIDGFAMLIYTKYEKEISEELGEILSSLMDMHHWGDKEMPPTYNEEGIKKLIKRLF